FSAVLDNRRRFPMDPPHSQRHVENQERPGSEHAKQCAKQVGTECRPWAAHCTLPYTAQLPLQGGQTCPNCHGNGRCRAGGGTGDGGRGVGGGRVVGRLPRPEGNALSVEVRVRAYSVVGEVNGEGFKAASTSDSREG